MLDGTHYYECQCDSEEHTIRYTLNKEDNEFYVSMFLNQYRNVFHRTWVAIKYIFNYKCIYGHWDCWTLSSYEDANRMIEMLKEIRPDDNHYRDKLFEPKGKK